MARVVTAALGLQAELVARSWRLSWLPEFAAPGVAMRHPTKPHDP